MRLYFCVRSVRCGRRSPKAVMAQSVKHRTQNRPLAVGPAGFAVGCRGCGRDRPPPRVFGGRCRGESKQKRIASLCYRILTRGLANQLKILAVLASRACDPGTGNWNRETRKINRETGAPDQGFLKAGARKSAALGECRHHPAPRLDHRRSRAASSSSPPRRRLHALRWHRTEKAQTPPHPGGSQRRRGQLAPPRRRRQEITVSHHLAGRGTQAASPWHPGRAAVAQFAATRRVQSIAQPLSRCSPSRRRALGLVTK